MHIEKNRVVTLNYTLRDEQGTIIDASSGRAPLSYLHGKGNIIPGLEQALVGQGCRRQAGRDRGAGAGLRAARRAPGADRAADEVRRGRRVLRPACRCASSGPQGPRIVIVVRVDRDFVTIDGNHPLAGRTLHFSVEIAEVRKASHEEVAHGHVHGPDGHHH